MSQRQVLLKELVQLRKGLKKEYFRVDSTDEGVEEQINEFELKIIEYEDDIAELKEESI